MHGEACARGKKETRRAGGVGGGAIEWRGAGCIGGGASEWRGGSKLGLEWGGAAMEENKENEGPMHQLEF
jgi:hypothetical protein